MADYTNVQQGDLDDAATISTVVGHENLADYVGFGLDMAVTYNAAPPTLDLTEGKVFVLLDTQEAPGAGHEKYDCLVVSHYDPRSDIALTDGTVNHIWAVLNVNTRDSPHIAVTGTDSPPAEDAVRIGTVDTELEEHTELNRDPDGQFEDLVSEDLWVNNSITWPDGVTTDTHPITEGETINNPNEYYDVEANDPPGTVAHADYADEAGVADWAREAAWADEAGDAEFLRGYSPQDLLDEAEALRAQPWDPLRDEPYVNDDYNVRPWVDFDVSEYDYDRYRVRLHVENDSDYSDGIGCYINGITDNCYNMINLLPREEYGERVTYRNGSDTWTVGSTMAKGHSLHEFYVALPTPIGKNGPRRQYPLFNAGIQHTASIGSYQLTGVLTKSVDSIDEIRLETGGGRLAVRAQIYGQHFFPDQYD